MAVEKVTAETTNYCFLDFDLNDYRSKLARAASFVSATNIRYGFSSPQLFRLGGAEVVHRVKESYEMDHEWADKSKPIETRPPTAGSRIVLKLLWEQAPVACENFATLCANGSDGKRPPVGQSGKPLTYRKSSIHRVVPQFIVQGGDFVFGNGSGGESIFNGKKFKDEREGLLAKHDRRGILSMGNGGKNSNSSQFFVTLDACPQCNGKHVVFGYVVSGWDVLNAIEDLGSSTGEPTASITITDCGVWKFGEIPGAGFWYDQPDLDSYSGISATFVVRPRVAVVVPSLAVLQKFSDALDLFTVVTPVIVDSSAARDASNPSTQDRVVALLNDFSVDVIVVAPACRMELTLPLPVDHASLWEGRTVVVQAKPVDALTTIRQQTWLADQDWQLDGVWK
jgi:peptidylprolyl isomerase